MVRFRDNCILEFMLVWILKRRYSGNLRRLRSIWGSRKIKVVFPVSNVSKWKVQSVYDEMSRSVHFEPMVALTIMDMENRITPKEQRETLEKNRRFFADRGCRVVEAYSFDDHKFIPFSEFKADIVWYTQPWDIAAVQDVFETSRSALTCYTPYFVQNYGGLDMDCGQKFHRLLWRHFTLSEAWAKEFEKYMGRVRAGRVLGLGHPMLDQFNRESECKADRKIVIYAPHWSCGVGERFSTFLENGQKILELARRHAEIDWVFKPHPSLRQTLIENRFMSEAEVEAYYSEWARIGAVRLDGNYVELFLRSSVMITDCASFLIEYACTGHPIIHLISMKAAYQPHPIARKLFSTYYQVHNWDEFCNSFSSVVARGEDPRRKERLEAVKEMRLLGNDAAGNAVRYVTSVLSGERR